MKGAALVLAGSRDGIDPVADAEGVPNKVLAELAGRSMIDRVVSSVEAAGFRSVAVSTQTCEVADEAARRGAISMPANTGPSASVLDAIHALGTPLLVTTGDNGLLQPEWITAFLADIPPGVDVAVLLANRELVEQATPTGKRTYLRFSDGHWSGCNLFYLRTPRAVNAVRLWQRVERDRKRPWRIVKRLGPKLLIRFLLGRLSLAEAVLQLGREAGVIAAVVPARDGWAATDVDTLDDLILVRQRIASIEDHHGQR